MERKSTNAKAATLPPEEEQKIIQQERQGSQKESERCPYAGRYPSLGRDLLSPGDWLSRSWGRDNLLFEQSSEQPGNPASLWPMYRLPSGPITAVGGPLLSRSKNARAIVLYHSDLQRCTSSPGWITKPPGLPTIHETLPKKNGSGPLLYVRRVWRTEQ